MGLGDLQYKRVYVSCVDNLVEDFYIPTLSESVLYQRKTGYFNSRALAMAARGISGLLEKGGKMQLLCSVELDIDDQDALKDPHRYLHDHEEDVIEQLHQPYDEIEKKRLALLAKLQARNALEIRVCVKQGGIYHEKTGIFADEDGNYVVFTGSGNETPGGWINNMENFSVFNSWDSKEYADEHREIFERQWNGEFPGLQTYPVSTAIYENIARFSDYYKEGMDEPVDPADTGIAEYREDWEWAPELAFISEAQRLWNYRDFAYGRTAVTPYDHQDYIASQALEEWPPRYILCDEVGLGKTIEAGMIIHGYIASGHIRRLLILAPKHVLKQWQQELYSKFGLKVWRLDGAHVYGPKFHPEHEPEQAPLNPENPFATKDMMLVSSQYARLDNRQEQLLNTYFDMVVLDEAHHARAHYKGGSRQPNKLLQLLQRLRYRTQGMLLLTATPIQVDRRELWDLLNVLELPGKWQSPDKFNEFIRALDAEHMDWGFLLKMASEYYEQEIEDPSEITTNIREDHPDVNIPKLLDILSKRRTEEAYHLSEKEKEALRLIVYRSTPIRGMAFRHTRELLKKYKDEGKFDGKIADRQPHKISITLHGSEDNATSEAGIYERIGEYVKEYYGKYKNIRKGLGFVMVTYRKRLTSSFEAIKISLQRRYKKLDKALQTGDPSILFSGILDENIDWEELEGSADIEDFEELDLARSDVKGALQRDKIVERMLYLIQEEKQYLQSLVHDLENLTTDSKLENFRERLTNLTNQGISQIIVFSQFKDTVNYLKDIFSHTFGERVGTYTGDGGIYFEDGDWRTCSKQEIQEKFRDNKDPLSILFCTDAASESLNLQTCSHMFNYDIPWNPMRIEQRIGRVDRIGQEAPEVHIYTYSYKDTVEERAFYRCLDRIDFFRTTLGNIQPILEATRKAIHDATMEQEESQEDDVIEEHFKSVAEIEEDTTIKFLLNTYEPQFERLHERVPVKQDKFEQILSNRLQQMGWTKQGNVWEKNDKKVTFDLEAFDRTGEEALPLTPKMNLAEIFGNLPPVPEKMENDGVEVRRVEAEGYTGFLVSSNSGYRLARTIDDLTGMRQGRVYHSVEDGKEGLARKVEQLEQQNLKSSLQIWQQRYKNWNTRVEMYLDELFKWVKEQEIQPGSLETFGKDELIGYWKRYLSESQRKNLQALAEHINYGPDPQIEVTRTKGRKRRSPRDSQKEEMFLKELQRINEKIQSLRQREVQLEK